VPFVGHSAKKALPSAALGKEGFAECRTRHRDIYVCGDGFMFVLAIYVCDDIYDVYM
jgi:hypothetical protein